MASVAITDLTANLRGAYRRGQEPFWALMSQAVTSGANFATTLIIIRSFGIVEFGRFSIAFLIMMISRSFLNGLVLAPMSAITSKLRGSSTAGYRAFLLANGLAFSVATSALLLVTLLCVGWLIGSPWMPHIALGLGCANLLANTADFFRRHLFVIGRSMSAFLVDVVRFTVQLPALLLLAHWDVSSGTNGSLYALALGGAAASLFGLALYGRLLWRPALNRVVWMRHWNFIKWMTPAVALDSISATAPLFLGAAFLGEAALGGVRAVQQLANILSLPTNALQQVAPSMAARVWVLSGPRRMVRLLVKLGFAGFALLLFPSIVIAVAWTPVARFTLGHHSAVLFPIFILYCVLNLISLIKALLFVFFQSSERPRVVSETGLLGAALTLTSVVILAPLLAELAIPIASLIGNLTAVAFLCTKLMQALKSSGRAASVGGKT